MLQYLMQGYRKMGNRVSQSPEERRRSVLCKKDVTMSKSSLEEQCIENPHKPQIKDVPRADRPPFTEEQKTLVRKSWKVLQEDMSRVGVVMFIGLFETHPDVQDLFLPFRNLTTADMKHNAQLKTHALKVMGTVEKALARLDEPKKLEDMLHSLGRRHSTYNIKPEYVDLRNL
uniref:Globin gb_IIIA n=1 Tax=Platynereis dumerilii TaxID=6359 RepID=A0A7T8HUQ5_PLADU|nr:globin gb_IIIA [Platynereis dumerilii]